jgi:hypothetical protein
MKACSMIRKMTILLGFYSSIIFSSCQDLTEIMSKMKSGNGLEEVWSTSAIAGNEQVTLQWEEQPPDYFDHVEITYIHGKVKIVNVGKGVKTCLIEGLSNDNEYTFVLKIVDAANNHTNGVEVKATPFKNINVFTPSSGSTIAAHETITVNFARSMNTETVVISGDIILSNAKLEWSNNIYANDKLSIRVNPITPKTLWLKGTAKLITINGQTVDGKVIDQISATYNVTYKIYVRPDGDPSYTGTRASPFNKIQDAINFANVLFAPDTSEVCVAKGLYQSDYYISGKPVIAMVEGVSVHGGFSNDWVTQNTEWYETVLEDTSVADNTATTTPTKTVAVPAGITTATIIDGFTIKIGKGNYTANPFRHAGIYCEGSPTISGNNIVGRPLSDSPGDFSYGIYIKNSSPVIRNNIIDAGANSGDAVNFCHSIGIYNNLSSSVIDNNIIFGGKGYITYGICLWGASTPVLTNNTIDCGDGLNKGYCIYIQNSTPQIDNNTFQSVDINIYGWGIFEGNGASDPVSLTNNRFKLMPLSGYWYHDYPSTNVYNLITPVSTGSGVQTLAYWGNYQ